MLRTYKAVLKGDMLEWDDEVPMLASPEHPVQVYVTILDETEPLSEREGQGQQMASVLQRLAAQGGLKAIPDPILWQQEVRQERNLPGRDENVDR